jgi:hypothetical protein
MKLIVSQLELLKRYVSREFHYVMTDLIQNFGWRHVETDKLAQGNGSLKDKLLDIFGELPETILFWEEYRLLNDHAPEVVRMDCRKCIFCDDLHWFTENMRRSKLAGFAMCDLVISPYAYLWNDFYAELSHAKVTWVPHAASPDFLVGFNENPENSIFLSGEINEYYPMRQQMKALAQQRFYPIVYHSHPGYHCSYDYDRNQNIGTGFAGKINRHRAAFTDSLKFGYVVAKYFEIPATGALLLADDKVAPQLRELGFEENVHYVPVSSENLEAQVRFVVDPKNHAGLDQIRRYGQELVWDRHRTTDRARQIDEACASVN